MTTEEVDDIISDIVNGTSVGVSGGSFKDKFGTVS